MSNKLFQAEPLKAYVQYCGDCQREKMQILTRPMTEDMFARHMADHGIYMTKADVKYAIRKVAECLIEVLAEGYRVKIDDIGTFKLTARDGRPHLSLVSDKKTAQLLKELKIKIVPRVW